MIRPVYSKYDHRANRWIFGLSGDDFQKVQAGYACGECLEDYGGIWRPSCPVCKNETETVVSLPREWRHG